MNMCIFFFILWGKVGKDKKNCQKIISTAESSTQVRLLFVLFLLIFYVTGGVKPLLITHTHTTLKGKFKLQCQGQNKYVNFCCFLMISVYWAISYDLVKAPRYKHESILKTEVDHTCCLTICSVLVKCTILMCLTIWSVLFKCTILMFWINCDSICKLLYLLIF